MQRRPLGKTGEELSILGFGGFHLLEIAQREGERLIRHYLDAGGNYVETAAGYGDGESELKVGAAIRGRRDDLILATKSADRTKVGCAASIERSLRNLGTDRIDVLYLHAVDRIEVWQLILDPGGAMEAVQEAQQAGKIRFVGISMHGHPGVLIEALCSFPMDVVMTTLNYYDRCNFPELERDLLPFATEMEVGIVGMKALADGLLWRSPAQALRYAWSLPITTMVAGTNTLEMLETDLQLAENFTPMGEEEIQELLLHAPELGHSVCRQCDRCLPCPQEVPIPDIFRFEGYYDRQMRDGIVRTPDEFALRDRLRFWYGGQKLAEDGYRVLDVKADACNQCGECEPRCPYGIAIREKLDRADYKLRPDRLTY